MDFHRHTQPYSRATSLGPPRDPDRSAPSLRLYEPPPAPPPPPSFLNPPPSQPAYESPVRRDSDIQRPHPYSLPSPLYTRDKDISRSPYASLRADTATNGPQLREGRVKDNNAFYRDGIYLYP